MRATSPKQVVHLNVSMSCYRGTFVWDSCLQLDMLSILEPECITHIRIQRAVENSWNKPIYYAVINNILYVYARKLAYVSVTIYFYAIFTGFIFHGFSIFADFALLNSQMLAIVPCISIDA